MFWMNTRKLRDNKALNGKHFFKPGGLNSRDQSRLRSRSSFVSRLAFENRQEYPSRWDQLFFFSVEIFKIEIFRLRFIFVEIFIEIVETNWDFRDLSRIFEISWHNQDFFETSGSKILTNWEISIEKCDNIVETDFFSVSRSRVSIETTSRQIETPRLTFFSFSYIVPKIHDNIFLD